MKEIVLISGKGGTGKTSLTAALGFILREKCIMADCDVDAADMHLLTNPENISLEKFYSGVLAVIDNTKCNSCDICKKKCRFNAIISGSDYQVDPFSCEGCGYCYHICPKQAISLQEREVGNFYISKTRFGNHLVHAELDIGAENSGKLVTKVKKEAKKLAKEKGIELILVDGSPGIGCPVISSLAGADYIILVTEPTLSAFHDLKRVHDLIRKFDLKAGCIINKSDLNKNIRIQVKDYLDSQNIPLLADIKFSAEFSNSLINGLTIMESKAENLKKVIKDIWIKIQPYLNTEEK